MTITVRSNDPAPAEPPPSALEAKASEQKYSVESDPTETEAKEDDQDDSEADGSDEEQEAKDLVDDKPKKKSGIQRRVDKLNARNAASRQEAEYWKQQALKGANDSKADAPKVDKPVVDTAGKPDPDTFETHAEYVEALTDWKLEQRDQAKQETERKTQLKTEQQKAMEAHTTRVKSFAEKNDDFEEVIESVDDVQVSPTIRELIITSDNGPELMYELAKNRAEFERINKLSPLAAARELGKIESRLASSKTDDSESEEPKKLTKAPKPIEPVGKSGKGAVAKSINDPNLSQAEYERLRREQIKRR